MVARIALFVAMVLFLLLIILIGIAVFLLTKESVERLPSSPRELIIYTAQFLTRFLILVLLMLVAALFFSIALFLAEIALYK